MSALSVQPVYPIFTDIDGQPLEDGYVWIGAANLDPQTNPINVYWDAALTLPAAQPIRTLAGYPSNSGTPARLYVNSDCSIRVMNKNGSAVYSAPSATERYSDAVISGVNAEDVIYDPPFIGGVQTNVEEKLAQTVSVKDFGAVGDGVADDTAAIAEALASIQSTGGALFFPRGTYLTDAIDLRGYQNITLRGDNEYSEFQYKPTSVIKIRSAAATGIKLADDNLEVPVSMATGIVLRDLVIDANSLATTAINMRRAVKMINCKVTGAVQDGIVFEGGSYPIHLQNVVSQGNGRDGLRVKAPLTTVYSIRDCEFGYNGGNGVTIFDGSTATFDSVLCQSNTGNGFHIQRLDPAGYTQPIFLERLKFSTCYSEANAGWGIYVDSYNTTPTTYTGKIVDLSFINSSFNSGVSKQAKLRGLTAPNIIGSPYLAAALDPAYNTVLLDRAAEYGELPWTARISQSQTNYFTTSGTTSAIYQRVGNWINCFITYSWSNKGSASSVFYAIIDELPFIALGGTFVQPATACSVRVSGGSTDIWHIIPIGGEKTARLVKNNKDDYALISDLPASGTLTAQFSYLAGE